MLRLLASTCLCLALLAAPAAAATVNDLKPCYVSAGEADNERETIEISGTDFAQGSAVDVLFDGVLMGSAPTDAVGEFAIRFPAPFQLKGERQLVVTVRDAATQVDKVTRVTNLAMLVHPRNATPGKRVRFRGRGFTQPAPVFAHYVFGGKVHKTVRLARRSTSPCGTFDVKRRLIPIDDARSGRWIMQVDQKRAYSPDPDPVWVRRPIVVTPVVPQATAGSAALARVKVSSPSAASTSIRSPAENSPLSRPSASGSTSRFEITRLSGRAP